MTFAIRDARDEDAAFVMALFARTHVRAFAHGPRSEDEFLAALLRAEQHHDHSVLIVERDGRPFGNATCSVLDGWLMEIRVVAFEEPRTGAGLFTLQWLLHHAFAERGLHRVFLEVLAENTGARALYERTGFRQEGCYRDGFRAADGTYHDLIPYGILAADAGAPQSVS